MAGIASSDKLVVVKAFAPGNPLPLDAREIHESLAAATEYAKSNATAYAGQTIKVVDAETNSVKAYTLVPSEEEGTNFTLKLGVGGGTGAGVVDIESGEIPAEGSQGPVTLKLSVSDEDGNVDTKDVPIYGAVTEVATNRPGILDYVVPNKDGAAAVRSQEIKGAVVDATYDANAKVITLPVVTGKSEGALPTATKENVVVDLKQVTKDAVKGVAVKPSAAGKPDKVTITKDNGAGATTAEDIIIPGVRGVAKGSSADKIKVTSTDGTDVLTETEVLIGAGSVKNPTYDAETRKITLPVLQDNGTTLDTVINLGKDMVVKSGRYDTAAKEIVLVLTDDSEVKIPAAELVDVYTGAATATVNVSVSDDNVITATLKISTVAKNILKSDANGAYVVEADFVDTKKAIADGDTAAKAYADSAVAKETEARNTKIGDLGNKSVKQYVDDNVSASGTKWVDFGAAK